MLTRLEVDGFKNLVDFSLDFGPYTCIAGLNGVGKSNIFDAIRFLSLLTECTINDAALQIRNAGEESGDIADLFLSDGVGTTDRIEFAVEMIVDKEVADDFGRKTSPTASFLRYEVSFRHDPPSATAGPLGGLTLEREQLRLIPKGQAASRLRFPHRKAFRDSVVYNRRHSRSGYISTDKDDVTGQPIIVIHQDGGSHGQGRPAPAVGAPRTIIGSENTASTPTILAARREMQSWRVLALEPSAMRRPDRFTDEPGITASGGHIPITLYHLANSKIGYEPVGDLADDILGRIAARLANLVPVRSVNPVQDDVRRIYSLELEELSGVRLRANSISDGTLRFLALTTIAEATHATGVYCMEEPENGIHPAKLNAMNRLLHDIAVDPEEAVAVDNPLRQVIVATHSPHFVQLQDKDDLVLAKNPAVRSHTGTVILPLECYPLDGSWRSRNTTNQSSKGRGVGMLELQSYIAPPEDAQLRFPATFWEVA